MGLLSTLLWSSVMFSVSAFAGFTSFRVRNQYQKAMIYLNAASTGVILAAAFTHLLPDAIEDLKQFSYPVAPAMSLTGFLLMVLVETALHSNNLATEHEIAAIEHEAQGHDCADHDMEHGADPVHNFLIGIPSSSFVKVKDKVEGMQKGCTTLEKQCNDNTKRRHSLTKQYQLDLADKDDNDIELSVHENQSLLHGEESRVGQGNTHHDLSLSFSHDHSHSHSHGHNHGHQNDGSRQKQERKRSGSVQTTTAAASTSLWLALVMHSLMEGFGIGVTSNPLKQTTLVLAVLIHKGFASLALASALLESGMEYGTFLTFFLTFSFASPLGAFVACLVSLEGGSTVLQGIVTGLASGSFMYIGFMEMLPAMLTSCQHMTDAMLLFVASAVAMAALANVV